MDVEDIRLREISQRQKDKNSTMPLPLRYPRCTDSLHEYQLLNPNTYTASLIPAGGTVIMNHSLTHAGWHPPTSLCQVWELGAAEAQSLA